MSLALSLFVPPFSIFSPNLIDWEICWEREAHKLKTEAGLFAMMWVNIWPVKKKKKRRERKEMEKGNSSTDASEQLPTRMTKLRLKLFSPQLDSHECWETV